MAKVQTCATDVARQDGFAVSEVELYTKAWQAFETQVLVASGTASTNPRSLREGRSTT